MGKWDDFYEGVHSFVIYGSSDNGHQGYLLEGHLVIPNILHSVTKTEVIGHNNGYSALGSVWQEPGPSWATGMALISCILGNFLRVVYHCFSPSLDIPTLAARCLHVLNDARDPSSKRWNYG